MTREEHQKVIKSIQEKLGEDSSRNDCRRFRVTYYR